MRSVFLHVTSSLFYFLCNSNFRFDSPRGQKELHWDKCHLNTVRHVPVIGVGFTSSPYYLTHYQRYNLCPVFFSPQFSVFSVLHGMLIWNMSSTGRMAGIQNLRWMNFESQAHELDQAFPRCVQWNSNPVIWRGCVGGRIFEKYYTLLFGFVIHISILMRLRIPTVHILFNFVLSNIPQIYFIQLQVFHQNSVIGQAVFKKKKKNVYKSLPLWSSCSRGGHRHQQGNE